MVGYQLNNRFVNLIIRCPSLFDGALHTRFCRSDGTETGAWIDSRGFLWDWSCSDGINYHTDLVFVVRLASLVSSSIRVNRKLKKKPAVFVRFDNMTLIRKACSIYV